jgi:hypothetical protein
MMPVRMGPLPVKKPAAAVAERKLRRERGAFMNYS